MLLQPRKAAAQRGRIGLAVLLLVLVLSVIPATPGRAAGSGTGDLMAQVPSINEHDLTVGNIYQRNNSCGVAAATMILDYYLPQTDPSAHAAIDLAAVAKTSDNGSGYVRVENDGTNTDQLIAGLQQAGPALDGVALTATLRTTDADHWFDVLKAELDAKLPVIVFMADGGLINAGKFHYGHFIVVSGYNADDSIVYHEPYDGTVHDGASSPPISNATFAADWGASLRTSAGWNTPWNYIEVLPPGVTSPVASTTPPAVPATAVPTTPPTVVPTPTSSIRPGGLWISPQNGATITSVIHFAAHAYPTHPSDPPVSHVNFTLNNRGNWVIACSVPAQDASGDVYACDVQVADLAGQVQVSFDVYDQAGHVNLAPNGIHTINIGTASAGSWTTLGTAVANADQSVSLVQGQGQVAGAAFVGPAPRATAFSGPISVTFTEQFAEQDPNSTADGFALVFQDASSSSPTMGSGGAALGVGESPAPGLVVGFVINKRPWYCYPSAQFFGLSSGLFPDSQTSCPTLYYPTTSSSDANFVGSHTIIVTASGSTTPHITVTFDGTTVVDTVSQISLPGTYRIGFGAGTGNGTEAVVMSNVSVQGQGA